MKSKKGKGLLGLVLAFVLVGVFGYFGYSVMGSIKLGLDLAGGVSITYQAKGDEPSAENMADTIYKLQQRVQTYSTEAEVYQEGSNRINIDIPGVSDANTILEALGKPGSLIFVDEKGETLLNGTEVATAKPVIADENGIKKYLVDITFTETGKQQFADATTKNIQKRIAIVYDGKIYSNPVVQEAITGGQCQISGMESYEEAESLASTIRIGSLKLELEELRSNVVGAKLGQEAISTSLQAGAIGFGIVFVFMLVAYLLPGLAADIALLLYVGVILVLLKAFEVTLTLPGVAGIILSIGMAVDANVIIFTRIKEEIGAGKSVSASIKAGFEKALSAIIDGNVTTLIAALVLFWRGSGTVKGFASTLAIGIVLSMFTALFVTKMLLNCLYHLGLQDPKFYGIKKDREPIDFVKRRKLWFAISILSVVIGFVALGVNKVQTGNSLNYSMEFKGGTSTNITFNEDLSLSDISTKVVPVVEQVTGDADVQTQKVAGTNEVIVKTKTLDVQQREALNLAMVDNFGVSEEKITAESISGAISDEMKTDAIIAVIIATLCMLLYIWLRFKDIKFAGSSVLALCHDVLVVLTFYALFRWSVGSTFIACMLTIVGYSINATIVIFDRVRENIQLHSNKTTAEIINISITQTITRSINTSFTTVVMVIVLFIMGVSSIREFALPLIVGIVCGTYSSVFVSGTLLYVMMEYHDKHASQKRIAAKAAKASDKGSNKKSK